MVDEFITLGILYHILYHAIATISPFHDPKLECEFWTFPNSWQSEEEMLTAPKTNPTPSEAECLFSPQRIANKSLCRG